MQKIAQYPEWLEAMYDPKERLFSDRLSVEKRTRKSDFIILDDRNNEFTWEGVCVFAKIQQGITSVLLPLYYVCLRMSSHDRQTPEGQHG